MEEYQHLCNLPPKDQILQQYVALLDTEFDPKVIYDGTTFFMNVKQALINECVLRNVNSSLAFIFRLLDQSYPISGTQLALADGYYMIKHIIVYGTDDDLIKFLIYEPDLKQYPKLIFKVLHDPIKLKLLINAGIRLNVVNKDGDDPLSASIKRLNGWGERTTLDIPPLSMTEREMVQYFDMNESEYEVFTEMNLSTDLELQIMALHELKRYMDVSLTKRANYK